MSFLSVRAKSTDQEKAEEQRSEKYTSTRGVEGVGRAGEGKGGKIHTVIEATIANGTSLDEVRTSSARVSSNEEGATETDGSMHIHV